MTKRVMGKASFANIRDMSGDMQLYVKRDDLAEGVYAQFKRWDLGDIIAAEGVMFRTQKGELSVLVDNIRLLTKSLRPLPEKFHGLSDQETRYRQRYVDLIMNQASRETFIIRTRIIDGIRRFWALRCMSNGVSGASSSYLCVVYKGDIIGGSKLKDAEDTWAK